MGLVRRASVLLAFAIVRSTPLHGQTASPAAVADSFLTAIATERWRDAAAYLELERFDLIRQQSIQSAMRMRSFPLPTPEELMARDSTLPRAVAEWEVQRARKAREQQPDFLSTQYAGVSTVDSLAALPTIDAAARWLQEKDARWRFHEVAIRNGCPEVAADTLLRQPPDVILGTIVSDSLAYVLYEPGDPPGPSPYTRSGMRLVRPSILVLRRSSGEWRVATQDDLFFSQGGVAMVGVVCPPRRRPPG